MVLRALEAGAATSEELALATKLPAGVVDVVLIELRNAGRVDAIEGWRFVIRAPA
jgi:hypothetical protein